MDSDLFIKILSSAIEILLDDGEGIIIDVEEGRFIVGFQNEFGVSIDYCIENDNDEFKNLEAGTIIKLKETVKQVPPQDLH